VRYVTDPSERQRILLSCHQHPTSGHMGTKKTLARVTERFMWPGVSKDVYSLVSSVKIVYSYVRGSLFACTVYSYVHCIDNLYTLYIVHVHTDVQYVELHCTHLIAYYFIILRLKNVIYANE